MKPYRNLLLLAGGISTLIEATPLKSSSSSSSSSPSPSSSLKENATPYNGTRNASLPTMQPLSLDPEFHFILAKVLALSNGGEAGAATAEVLRAASQIIPGDFESWYTEFEWLGSQMHDLAVNEARTAVSRRKTLFRSSSYLRMASFFLVGDAEDARLYDSYSRAVEDFHQAIRLLPNPGENFTVKASSSTEGDEGKGYTVPGYFFPAGFDGKEGEKNKRRPTIVAGSGFDAAQEDTWHQMGQEALDRGYNFVTYEGPGQPTVRRDQGLGFTPRWWEAVTPVVDWLAQRDDVDMDNLALVGYSFGGVLAPLAASREKRFKAVLSVDGMTDMQKVVLEKFPKEMTELYGGGQGNATEFDEAMRKGLREAEEKQKEKARKFKVGMEAEEDEDDNGTQLRWGNAQGLWSFNTGSQFDWIEQMGAYKVTQEVVDRIEARAWVGKGQDDELVQDNQEGQLARMFNESSTAPDAAFYTFKTDLGAGSHCQLGSEPYLALVTYDWLDGVFGSA